MVWPGLQRKQAVDGWGIAMAIDTVWFVIGGYALAAIIVAVGLAYYFRR
jgi:hypothetical protein